MDILFSWLVVPGLPGMMVYPKMLLNPEEYWWAVPTLHRQVF